MGELEATLVDSLSQLERFSPGAPGDARAAGPVGAPDWAHVYLSVLPTLPVRAPLQGFPGFCGKQRMQTGRTCTRACCRRARARCRARPSMH